MKLHSLVRQELDNLEIQFPGQAQINLDEYAELYKINRRYASQHLQRRNIPATKEGKCLYISMTDLATYKAQRKSGKNPLIIPPHDGVSAEMKRRRGFCQMAEQRQFQS
ncbi:MAG: helix-turn-helix domain-containing protein [Oscillospiraceae bacterium]|jgi:hypothetical protein|nr:helix-turn-helix domain-containing protein [Oscillospiraceae bacterium]